MFECSIISLITHLARSLCLNTFINYFFAFDEYSRTQQSASNCHVVRKVRLFTQRNARARLRHLLFRRNTESRSRTESDEEKKKRERKRTCVQLRSRGIERKRRSPKLICIPCCAASNLSRVKQAEF